MFKFAYRISVFALMAVGLYAQTSTTPPAQETLTSGIVGIAEGQTARLNALNAGVVPPAATGASCSGLLAFVADDGTILKTKTVSVAAGASGETTYHLRYRRFRAIRLWGERYRCNDRII